MTKVSVVIPLFNKEIFIGDCIRSVLNQSYSPDEIIIVDDCSSDSSVTEVRKFEDERIKLFINKENLGTAKNANYCMELAESGIVIRQDADDIMPPFRIEKQVNFLLKHNEVAAVAGKNQRINEHHNSTILLDETKIKDEFFFTNPVSQPTAAFNLDLINSEMIRYENEGPAIGEDWLFFYKLSKKFRIVNLNEVFNLYRIHEGNISDATNPRYDSDIEMVIRYIFSDNKVELSKEEMSAHLLFRKKLKSDNFESLTHNFVEWTKRLRNINNEHKLMNILYLEKRIIDATDFLFYSVCQDKKALTCFRNNFSLNRNQRKYLIKLRIKRILGFR